MISTQLTRLIRGLAAIAAVGTLIGCNTQAPVNQTTSTSTPQLVSTTKASVVIRIDGSSTVFPISEAVAKEFRKSKGARVGEIEVKFSGTRAGFNQFCAGETLIANASRPILLRESQICANSGIRFIEIPIAFDALTIAVNAQNTWAKDVTLEELKKIWESAAEGKIKNWNQVRASYPDRPLTLFGAGRDSGTFDYFNTVAIGNPAASRSDYVSSEDDNQLVQGMQKDASALGYIPLAYYEASQNQLKALAVNAGKGAVLPSRETVINAQYQPFARPLFIYVNAKAVEGNAQLKAFVEYYLTHVGRIAIAVGYIPLPPEAYRLATLQFTQREIGTVFEGVPQPNVTITELLRRQAVFQQSRLQK